MKEIYDCNHWYYIGKPHGWHEFYSVDIGDIIDTRLQEQNKDIKL